MSKRPIHPVEFASWVAGILGTALALYLWLRPPTETKSDPSAKPNPERQSTGLAPAVSAAPGLSEKSTIRPSDREARRDTQLARVASALLKLRLGDQTSVRAYASNSTVLLVGVVDGPESRAEIERYFSKAGIIGNVVNEISTEARPLLDFSKPSCDDILRELDERLRRASHTLYLSVYPACDDKVLYLLGSVNIAEADTATEIARTVPGASKVVRIFELTSR